VAQNGSRHKKGSYSQRSHSHAYRSWTVIRESRSQKSHCVNTVYTDETWRRDVLAHLFERRKDFQDFERSTQATLRDLATYSKCQHKLSLYRYIDRLGLKESIAQLELTSQLFRKSSRSIVYNIVNSRHSFIHSVLQNT
jgi:hypothetical protein